MSNSAAADLHLKLGIPSPLEKETPCDSCNKDGAIVRCSQCLIVYYCNKDCQRKDWKSHKPTCLAMAGQQKQFELKNNELEEFSKRYDESSNEACSICYEIVKEVDRIQLSCQHIFCSSCMARYHEVGNSSCPLCRSDMDTNVFQLTYQNACYFLQKANRFPVDSMIHIQSVKVARKEFDRVFNLCSKVPSSRVSLVPIEVSYLDLLKLEKKYDEVLTSADKLLPMLGQSYSMYVEVLLIKANVLEELLRYPEALGVLYGLMADDNVQNSGAKLCRTLYHSLLRCLYKNGNFEKALVAGHMTLESNKHYEGVYEYIALSYKALGMWDEAIAVMRRAVRYETPWDRDRHAVVQAKLQELLDERANLLASK